MPLFVFFFFFVFQRAMPIIILLNFAFLYLYADPCAFFLRLYPAVYCNVTYIKYTLVF